MPSSPSEGGVTSAPVSPSEEGMASAPVSFYKGGVSPVSVSPCEGGVASHPSNLFFFLIKYKMFAQHRISKCCIESLTVYGLSSIC